MIDKNEKQEPQKISGTVDGIVAYKAESGFVVFDLDMQGELVTVVGELGKVEAGEEVSLTGTFASHPTYGTQFRADVCERRLPASATAIRKYLSGGSFKGVGPAIAKRIVEAFGEYHVTHAHRNQLCCKVIKSYYFSINICIFGLGVYEDQLKSFFCELVEGFCNI